MTLAIVARIKVSKHPNADRLQIGTVSGNQVVVGPDIKDGDLGVFFSEGLQLSEHYTSYNDLVRRKDANGNLTGGFFEATRRVRAQKFRGVKSEGYWAPLESLEFAGDITKLKEGDKFESFGAVAICNKYVTEATLRARKQGVRGETVMFKKHFDTDQLTHNLDKIKSGSNVVVTLKMHGTSQRTGHVQGLGVLPWWKRWLRYSPPKHWTYLTGSRNVILGKGTGTPYHDEDMRHQAADYFIGALHKGETIFYEIVGYEPGRPIMGRHKTDDKELIKQYGKEITYSYGCGPGQFKIYVYRITMTNVDGVTFDLPWANVKQRCEELGVVHVPELAVFTWVGDNFLSVIDTLTEGPDPVDARHPREGVCIRVENTGKNTAVVFKHKSFTFKILEGIIKDNKDYVDTEEAA